MTARTPRSAREDPPVPQRGTTEEGPGWENTGLGRESRVPGGVPGRVQYPVPPPPPPGTQYPGTPPTPPGTHPTVLVNVPVDVSPGLNVFTRLVIF